MSRGATGWRIGERSVLELRFWITSGLPTNHLGFSSIRCNARFGHDPVSKSVADGQSGQAYAPEKVFKAFMRAVSVKNRIDGEISHPNRVIVIGRLEPFERVVFSV